MTYGQAIEFLYGLQMFGAKLGLDNPRRLAALAGHPEAQLRFIHVAGTNGKGSTCAMLESVYRQAGLRTGLFTSPHLVSFSERIQVNRVPISEPAVASLVEEMRPWLGQFPPGGHPTFFEVTTLMALLHFAREHCDLVIWETGLGGRLDATNIITPLASVITGVDWDHEQWLGNTLDQIATEKAGIVKPHIPVITGARAGGGLEVIREKARQEQAPLTVVADAERVLTSHGGRFEPGLPGAHQRFNAALAVSTVRVLQQQIEVTPEAVAAGIQRVHWPGRFQQVKRPGGGVVALDGAHNPAGAVALRATLDALFPGQRPALILGVLSDKDWVGLAGALAPVASRILVVPVKSGRTLDPELLARECRRLQPGVPVDSCPHLEEALRRVEGQPLVVLAGSLYLVGEALEHLGLSAVPAVNERALNEWVRSA